MTSDIMIYHHSLLLGSRCPGVCMHIAQYSRVEYPLKMFIAGGTVGDCIIICRSAFLQYRMMTIRCVLWSQTAVGLLVLFLVGLLRNRYTC